MINIKFFIDILIDYLVIDLLIDSVLIRISLMGLLV
jgi:hypothetical protein